VKPFLILLFCLWIVSTETIAVQHSLDKKPDWVNYNKRKSLYSADKYLIGFASEKLQKGNSSTQMMKNLSIEARKYLTEAIYVSIKNISYTEISNLDQKTLEYFKQTSLSVSKIELPGLNSETYFDEKNEEGFAFCFVEKQVLKNIYINLLNKQYEELKNASTSAHNAFTNKQKEATLKEVFSCFLLFREIEVSQIILLSLENNKAGAIDLKINEVIILKNTITNLYNSIQKSSDLNIPEAATLIANSIRMQNIPLNKSCCLQYFTFETSGAGSMFSLRLNAMLESKFSQAGISTVQEDQYIAKGKGTDSLLAITGTYWKEDSALVVICILRDNQTGSTLASSEVRISIAWLEKNSIEFIPKNLENTVIQQTVVNTDPVISEGLRVDFTTNKGIENIIFKENDIMRLFVKAGKECYLRFIYYLSDGTPTLLLDNYKVDANKVDKVFELPYKFQCSAPFGIENLQLIASTQEFTALSTVRKGGYLIINESIREALAKTRSATFSNDFDGFCEKQILITTLPRE